MNGKNFSWLLKWYEDRCNGVWECNRRIYIGSLDNPGWSIIINLKDTELENKEFKEIEVDRSDNDWLMSFRKNNFFEGHCGTGNVIEVLQIFRIWAENYTDQIPTPQVIQVLFKNEANFLWLLKWFEDQCDGDWEHDRGITIESTDNSGWSVSILVLDTELENKYFKEILVERSDSDWFRCFIKNHMFEGRCGKGNLIEVLHIFRLWAESVVVE
jgi:hypothetical protein